MLVTLSNILEKAEHSNYAVVAPDFTTLPTTRFILEAAEEFNAPLILSYTSHIDPLCPVRSWEKWIRIIREECELYDVDVCLHLDHGRSVDLCRRAVDAGFTGIMIDASDKPFAENVELTSRVVEFAHAAGVSVESEIGHVGTSVDDDYHTKDASQAHLTQPEQAQAFALQTGTDCLAVAIGTIHGAYVGEPHIDLELLGRINDCVHIPLVIHGGSGTGEKNIKEMISNGIRKVNVFHDWIVPSQNEIIRIISEKPKDVGGAARVQKEVIRDVLYNWFQITESVNKG